MRLPKAQTEPRTPDRPVVSEKPRLRKFIAKENLSGLANDTKWNELIDSIRGVANREWRPSFRFNCIDAEYISEWDCDWSYHLPFPFMSVRWFDLSYIEVRTKGQLLPEEHIDHSKDIEDLLTRIGLDYEKGDDFIRIFGYAPRDRTDFTPI